MNGQQIQKQVSEGVDMADKLQMVCSTCGSTEVRRDADAAWNPEKQAWELVTTYDNATCEDCEGECSIKEIPYIPAPPDPSCSDSDCPDCKNGKCTTDPLFDCPE